MNPDGVREILLDNFCGVRVDGTNVTDIEKETGAGSFGSFDPAVFFPSCTLSLAPRTVT